MTTTSSASKMTSRIALTYVLTECVLPDDVREKLTSMVAALDKKSASRSTTPTKKQVESALVRERIKSVLAESSVPMCIADVAEKVGITSGSASAHLTIMKKEGTVVRTEDKRKAYFALAQVEG